MKASKKKKIRQIGESSAGKDNEIWKKRTAEKRERKKEGKSAECVLKWQPRFQRF